jgi:hypothetical protein
MSSELLQYPVFLADFQKEVGVMVAELQGVTVLIREGQDKPRPEREDDPGRQGHEGQPVLADGEPEGTTFQCRSPLRRKSNVEKC